MAIKACFSMALVWLGTAAGRILIMHQEWKARVIRLAADKILGTYITPQVDCVGLHPWIGSCCPGRLLFERWADPNQQEPLVPLLHLCHGRHGLLPSHAALYRDRRLQVLGWCSFALSWQVPAINLLLV